MPADKLRYPAPLETTIGGIVAGYTPGGWQQGSDAGWGQAPGVMPPPPGYPGGFGAPPSPYGYAPAPTGLVQDPASGLWLPQGTALSGVGRRIGAYFLSLVLVIVTLGIGYVIWSLFLWPKGTSPAFRVLGLHCWVPDQQRPATFGRMALRNIVGGIAQGILGWLTGLVSFVIFCARSDHKSLMDLVGGTVVIHDPNRLLG